MPNTRWSGDSGTSSTPTSPAVSPAARSPRRQRQLEVQRLGDLDDGLQRRIRSLGREQPTHHFGALVGESGEFGLAEPAPFAFFIKSSNDCVDRIDPLPLGA